jgi:dTDP-4-dehydrorhamnose reductase
MAPHNLALTGAMTKDDLTAVAKGNGWKAQRIQLAQLLTKARNFRTELAQHIDFAWHTDGQGAHHCGSRYDFAQRIFRFIHIHRNEILQSPSLPVAARAEALSCLGQWEHSLQEARFSPYAL